jgi:quinohemoprotein amine dehydrogenase
MVVEPAAAEDEFTTRVKLQSIKDGSVITRSGQGLVYAGYSWRGRSKPAEAVPAGRVLAADDFAHDLREVLWFSPDQSQAEGRWFWGEYQEFGFDVRLRRATSEASLTGVDLYSMKTGTLGQRVRLIGDSFPADASVNDLDFGAGVKVRRLVSHTNSELVAEVDVAADAVPGKRDIAFRRAVLENAVAVFDRVDYIKVTPEASLARLGSETHPKGYQQFEAVAYQRGADDKPHTADDVELGPVDVSWSLEEFYAVFGDDDKEFVGKLDPATGLFTPASDGPNPQRKFMRNNYGDVWAVATAKSEKDKEGKALSGRSYLVVTVPTYIRWDQPEVGQ